MNKEFLRKEMLEKRGNIESRYKNGLDKEIEERLKSLDFFKSADKILMFAGSGSDINTSEFIKDFLKMGKRIFIPAKDEESGIMHAVEIKSLKNIVQKDDGILEPAEGMKVVKRENFDLVLMPAAAYDRSGGRVGYGSEGYEVFIQTLDRNIPKAGVCYNFQLIDEMHPEEYNIRADYLVTEQKVIITKANLH